HWGMVWGSGGPAAPTGSSSSPVMASGGRLPCSSWPASWSGWCSCAGSTRLADPLLDLRLFRSATFSAALTTNLLTFFVGFGILLFIPHYLQLVLGLSPRAAGLWMPPSPAGLILGVGADPGAGPPDRPSSPRSSSVTCARAPSPTAAHPHKNQRTDTPAQRSN